MYFPPFRRKSYPTYSILTFCLNFAKSAGVKVSALAMTGIKLTREPKRFMTSMSKGDNLGNH